MTNPPIVTEAMIEALELANAVAAHADRDRGAACRALDEIMSVTAAALAMSQASGPTTPVTELVERLQMIADELMGYKEVNGIGVNETCQQAADTLTQQERMIEAKDALIEAAYDAGVARALKQLAEGRWGSNDKANDLAALSTTVGGEAK